MVFKGTLGTGGTITSLPSAASGNEGYTYKVITAGTYASTAAKVGDVFVSNGSSWILIPAGDTDTDTWRNIKVNGTEKLTTGISSGAVDFINGTNTSVSFDSSGNKIKIDATDTTYTFDGTYNSSSNKAATVSTVTNAINALDGGTIGTPGAGKTVTALSQTNGNISATFGNISITKSQVSDFPTGLSSFSNDAGFITSADVPEGASAYTGTTSAVGTTASNGTNNGFARGDHVHNITSSTITSALGYTPYNSTNPNGYTTNTGTVTKVRVQATSPVNSSTSTEQSQTLNTTISLADAYGDTKNPYGTKTKNYVLAGPTTGSAAAPSFRALVADDIPDLSGTYLTSFTETDPIYSASAAAGITSSDITNWNGKTSLTIGTSSSTAAAGNHAHGNITNGGDITATAPTIASGDKLIINDESASKVTNGPSFGTSTTQYLANNGTWQNIPDTSSFITDAGVTKITTTAGSHTAISNATGAVSFNVPTKTSHLTNDSGYLTSSDIASVMQYKGTKASYSNLPNSDRTVGDVWHITDTGSEYAWDGSTWQELGTAIDLSGYMASTNYPDLVAIEGLTGTSGLLKKTAANTWSLDTNTYLKSSDISSWAKASSKPSYSLSEITGTDDLQSIEGLSGTTGLLKKTAANTWTLDTNTYLTSVSLNGSTSTSPSFYAPTAAGTSGQVLISSGSSAPTWGTVTSGPQNLKDGSTTGSLRSVGSISESASYTIGQYALTEGKDTKASGYGAHAEGEGTIASGDYSHTEGFYTTASGDYSHAEGSWTVASGIYSHASGKQTTAQRRSQTTIGEFNVLDITGNTTGDKGSYIFIVGNGTDTSARSNALTIDWDGSVIASGAVTCGSIDDNYGLNDEAILSEATMELWGELLS